MLKRMTMGLTMLVSISACAMDTGGHWKSAGAEDMGNGSFATREFVLTDSTWNLVFTIYGDKELKAPLMAITFEGTWKQTGQSKTVKGANEATFEFNKKSIELKADVAKNFGMDGCGLAVGTKKDVSKDGCGFVASVTKYPREFDLVSRKGEQLFLGARPADGDMSTAAKRPTALGAPLIK